LKFILKFSLHPLRILHRDSHDALGETKVSRITADPLQNGKKKDG